LPKRNTNSDPDSHCDTYTNSNADTQCYAQRNPHTHSNADT
jgi:hypothetical protein